MAIVSIQMFINELLKENEYFFPKDFDFSIYIKDKYFNTFTKSSTFLFNYYFPYKEKKINDILLLDMFHLSKEKGRAFALLQKDNKEVSSVDGVYVDTKAINIFKKSFGLCSADTLAFILWHEIAHIYQKKVMPQLDKNLIEMYADCFAIYMVCKNCEQDVLLSFGAKVSNYRHSVAKSVSTRKTINAYDTKYAVMDFCKNKSVLSIQSIEQLHETVLKSVDDGKNTINHYNDLVNDVDSTEETLSISYEQQLDNINKYNFLVEQEKKILLFEGLQQNISELKDEFIKMYPDADNKTIVNEIVDYLVDYMTNSYHGLIEQEIEKHKVLDFSVYKENLIDTFAFKTLLDKVIDKIIYKPNKIINFRPSL